VVLGCSNRYNLLIVNGYFSIILAFSFLLFFCDFLKNRAKKVEKNEKKFFCMKKMLNIAMGFPRENRIN